MPYVSLRDLPRADPGRPDLRSPTRLLVWVGRNQLPALWLGVFWGVLWMGAQALIPGALGAGIQAISDDRLDDAIRWSLVVLALGVFQAFAGLLRHRAAVTNWISAASRIQQLVVRQAARFGGRPARARSPPVRSWRPPRTTSERIGSAFDVLARFAGAVVAFFGVAAILLSVNTMLGTIVLVGVPLLSLAIGPLRAPARATRARPARASSVVATELAADTVAGLRVLRGIGGEDLFLERYQRGRTEVRRAAVRTAQIQSLLDALQVLLPGLFVVSVTWLGARLASRGSCRSASSSPSTATPRSWSFPCGRSPRPRTSGPPPASPPRGSSPCCACERTSPTTRPAEACRSPGRVRWSTPRQRARRSSPGCSPPSSPTTPATAGTASPTAWAGIGDGDVTARRRPARDTCRSTMVRRRVLVQDKDPMILSGARGRACFDVPGPGPGERRRRPARRASADDVVEALPEGLATDLPERGRSLSGGQRQRLALARSLVADPDDPRARRADQRRRRAHRGPDRRAAAGRHAPGARR